MSSFNIFRRRRNKRAGQWLYRTGRLSDPVVQAFAQNLTNKERNKWARSGYSTKGLVK